MPNQTKEWSSGFGKTTDFKSLFVCLLIFLFIIAYSVEAQIPLSEHPRPDFSRPIWKNLNGPWDFKFDSDNRGLKEGWFKGTKFDKKIIVPFPWGSKLSKVKDE